MQDFIVHAAPQFLAEVRFERGARHAHVIGHLLRLDALAGVLANEVARLHHLRVLEGLVARGGKHVQAGRRHQDARAGQARAIQHLVQQMRRRAAHFLGALDHGTQWNAREHARQRVVVDADQGHLLRHGDARMHARLQQLARARVAHGDDADGFFQAVEPGDLLLHRFVP